MPALLDDDSEASPLTRIVQAATAYGRTVGGFAGTPELAKRFRERGISCVAVATDLWITAEGARAALRPDSSLAPLAEIHPGQPKADHSDPNK